MGAAVVGVVGRHRIAGRQGWALAAGYGRQQADDAVAHGAQVHGDMGCVGHQVAAAIEEGTGEIQPLFDVHRAGGLPQPLAHPLGDGAEAVLEQFQLYRIHARRPGVRCLHLSGCLVGGGVWVEGSIPLQQQFAGGQHLGAPALGQKDGAGGLNDQGRPHQHLAAAQTMPVPQGHGLPAVGSMKFDRCCVLVV